MKISDLKFCILKIVTNLLDPVELCLMVEGHGHDLQQTRRGAMSDQY